MKALRDRLSKGEKGAGEPTGAEHVGNALKVVQQTVSGSGMPFVSEFVSGALGLVESANTAKLYKKELEQLAGSASDFSLFVSETMRQHEEDLPKDLEATMTDLKHAFDEINRFAFDASNAGPRLSLQINPERAASLIDKAQKDMSTALTRFGLSAMIGLQTSFPRLERMLREQAERQDVKDSEHNRRLEQLALEQAERDTMSTLRTLPYAAAGWDPMKTCLTGTRVHIIDGIVSWASGNPDVPNVFWLSGVAGSGKTTISHSVAEKLEGRCLVSSFFFQRDNAARNRPDLVITTLAMDLASNYPELRQGITTALRAHPTVISSSLTIQFRELIANPVAELLAAPRSHLPPKLIIWDALDECSGLKEFLRVLGHDFPMLKSVLRFFVTSRPLTEIDRFMASVKPRHYPLLPTSENTIEDLTLYVRHGLQLVALECPLSNDDPAWLLSYVEPLVNRTAGLFIWAATALRLLDNSFDPSEQLEQLLSQTSVTDEDGAIEMLTSSLDKLYTVALPDASLLGFTKAFQRTVGAIMVIQKPLHSLALSHLLCYDMKVYKDRSSQSLQRSSKDTVNVLSHLQAVISAPSAHDTINVLHPSFFDFLTTPSRPPSRYFIDTQVHHARVAELCLTVMHDLLRSDICQLRQPNLMNDEIDDLSGQLKQHVPEALEYACTYFADHVQALPDISNLLPHLQNFYFDDLLTWLEVMSLLKLVQVAITSLSKLQAQVPHTASARLHIIADDATRFAEQFIHVLHTNAAHIYVSALAFTPHETVLSQVYSQSALHVLQGQEPQWSPCRMIYDGHTEYIKAVAISPDGARIASAGDDWTVRIWETKSGRSLLASLRGHTAWVNSCAFSWDGKYVVSGSNDYTLRVWDARTGQLLLGPLKEHEDCVNGVAFSPNGACIVSGSCDKTIRLWDVKSGKPLLSPFVGHTHFVRSVAFSRDGLQIVSASNDCSIRVWDASKGTCLLVLEGHTKTSSSAVFSDDGAWIVSGSRDNSVRIWNRETGKLVLPPLELHNNHVNSVAISRDRKLIVSGSSDKSICLWNAETGEPLLPVFKGHGNVITSVLFSHDGQHILSGSQDYTIRRWDATPGKPLQALPEIHSDWVITASFSPDGRRIASGSWDRSVRIWEARTGKLASPPCIGHNGPVNSVIFSRDGRFVVSAGDDGTLRVWDAITGRLSVPPLEGHRDAVRSVVFSGDGRRIASGSRDGTVRIWAAESAHMLLEIPTSAGGEQEKVVLFSPDLEGSQVFSGRQDFSICAWSTETGNPTMPSLRGHTDWVQSLSVSSDGTRLISGSSDWTIRLWDIPGHALISVLEGHIGAVYSLKFTADDQYIISSSYDNTVRIWAASSGQLLLPPPATYTSLMDDPYARRRDTLARIRDSIPCGVSEYLYKWDELSRPQPQPEETKVSTRSTRLTDVGEDMFYMSQDGWLYSVLGGARCWILVPDRGLFASTSNCLAFGKSAGRLMILRLDDMADGPGSAIEEVTS